MNDSWWARRIGVHVNFERAFNPSRAVRRGWAVWYRAPVLLTVLAFLIVCVGLLADSLLKDVQIAAISELVERLPNLPYGVSLPSIGRSTISPSLAWVGPLVLLLVAARTLFDVISFRIHVAVITQGRPSSNRDSSGVLNLVLQLFVYYLLSFGAVVGAVVAAGSVGALVIMWGVSSGSSAVTIFGMAVAVISVVPVWIYVNLGVYLGSRVVVFERVSAVDALERSWSLAKGHRWSLIVFRIIISIFVASGFLAGLAVCGVGVILSLPVVCAVASASLTESFMLATTWGTASEWLLPLELGEPPM